MREQTLERLLQLHVEAHLRDVVTVILEGEGNDLALVQPIIAAVSAILLAHTAWWERDASGWLEVFDHVDLVALHDRVKSNRRAARPADAIVALVFAELSTELEPPRGGAFRVAPKAR